MCFSATASFAASGVTGIAAIAAMAGAKTPAHRLLACIPISFALQQFAEGVLWRTLEGHTSLAWQAPAMFLFLILAKVVWPVVVPVAIRGMENEAGRRRLLTGLLGLGVVESAAFAYSLTAYPVTAAIAGGHIAYHIETPPLVRLVVDTLYVVTVTVPPFVSSTLLMRVLGVGVVVSLIVAKLAYYTAAASVWCFFAAFISVLIVVVVRADVARITAASTGSERA
ncbi:MAG: hypothetical protein E4H38_00005 [Gemmatimonadales bacterium]|nr:MAG: hypothetical protein E4H38_00005 [Gemmatimonadales bacterium]